MCSLYLYILLLLITVCYYYMHVSTKYHWNISFQKKLPLKYVVKKAKSVTHFVWQINKKILNIYTRILDIINCFICQEITYPYWWFIKKENINILKRKPHVGINVVLLELILTLYDVCFLQNISIAPFWPSHRLGDPKMSGA